MNDILTKGDDQKTTQKESHVSEEEHAKTQLWSNKEILRTSLKGISSVDTTSWTCSFQKYEKTHFCLLNHQAVIVDNLQLKLLENSNRKEYILLDDNNGLKHKDGKYLLREKIRGYS